jgi:hypothetical protein
MTSTLAGIVITSMIQWANTEFSIVFSRLPRSNATMDSEWQALKHLVLMTSMLAGMQTEVRSVALKVTSSSTFRAPELGKLGVLQSNGLRSEWQP